MPKPVLLALFAIGVLLTAASALLATLGWIHQNVPPSRIILTLLAGLAFVVVVAILRKRGRI